MEKKTKRPDLLENAEINRNKIINALENSDTPLTNIEICDLLCHGGYISNKENAKILIRRLIETEIIKKLDFEGSARPNTVLYILVGKNYTEAQIQSGIQKVLDRRLVTRDLKTQTTQLILEGEAFFILSLIKQILDKKGSPECVTIPEIKVILQNNTTNDDETSFKYNSLRMTQILEYLESVGMIEKTIINKRYFYSLPNHDDYNYEDSSKDPAQPLEANEAKLARLLETKPDQTIIPSRHKTEIGGGSR